MKTTTKIHQLSLIAVMSAIVYITTQLLHFNMPISIGSKSMIHFGNAACMLAGLILGPIAGGLSAGIGSALYDFGDPAYASQAPITFVFKFVMAFIVGKIAYGNNSNAKINTRNIVAVIVGGSCYMLMYFAKTFITNVYFLKVEVGTAIVSILTTNLPISTVNLVVGCIASIVLSKALIPSLAKSKLGMMK